MGGGGGGSLPFALYPLQAFLQVVQVGGGGAAVGGGVGVVLLLVQLAGLLQLRQLAVEHVGGGRHRRLGGQQRGDGRSLLRLVLVPPDALLLWNQETSSSVADYSWEEL